MSELERLIRTDWVTFPCQNKVPAVKGWTALTSSVPHRNGSDYGILCGQRNGLIVVDCDVLKRDKDDTDKLMCGLAVWAALEQQFPELSQAPRVRTRSGGLHVYFAYTPRLRPSIQRLSGRLWGEPRKRVKIDVLSDGRFVVGPGSSGYTFDDDAAHRAPATLPDALIDILNVDDTSSLSIAAKPCSNPATHPAPTNDPVVVADGDGTRFVLRPGPRRPPARRVDKTELRRCVRRLPATLADNYHTWTRALWSIAQTAKSNGYDATDIAIEFSKRAANKFKSDRDVLLTYHRNNGSLNYATLNYLARTARPT